jgi:hypothetical protein
VFDAFGRRAHLLFPLFFACYWPVIRLLFPRKITRAGLLLLTAGGLAEKNREIRTNELLETEILTHDQGLAK